MLLCHNLLCSALLCCAMPWADIPVDKRSASKDTPLLLLVQSPGHTTPRGRGFMEV